LANLKYPLLVVCACCALIAVAYLPPPERLSRWSAPGRLHVDSILVEREDDPGLWEAAVHLEQLSSRLNVSRRYLSLLERRDSVLASLRAEFTSGAGLHVVSASEVPSKALEQVRSLASDLTRDFPIGRSTTPLAVALVLDTLPPRTPASSATIVHSVPTTESNVCLTTIVLGRLSLRELDRPLLRPEQIVRANATRLLGMCAYFGRFGEPGRHVAHWLRQSRYAPALVAEWLRWPLYRPPESVRSTRRLTGYSWRMSLERVRCASGDLEACSSIATREAPWLYSPYDADAPTDVVVGGRRRWEYDWHALGGEVDHYLSDLVIAMGEDRFQAFWSSDLELEAGFEEAFGISIGQWTMQWSRDQIGIPHTGPSATPGATVMAFLLGIVFVGGGVAYASHREAR
jgi:hypothetical protein